MSSSSVLPWASLERSRGTMFLAGASILVGAAVVASHDAVEGTDLALPLGQMFIGAGWTAVLVGLLGLYPGLAERSRWLARAGLLFTVIGVIGYVVVTVLCVAVFTGILAGDLESYAPVFLPPVAVGSFLTFPRSPSPSSEPASTRGPSVFSYWARRSSS